MHNGENFNFDHGGSEEENSAELSRKINEERGEKVNQAELEAREKELLEQLAKLESQLADEEAEYKALKDEIGVEPSEVIAAAATIEAANLDAERSELSPESAANLEKAPFPSKYILKYIYLSIGNSLNRKETIKERTLDYNEGKKKTMVKWNISKHNRLSLTSWVLYYV